jgi:hypothetical protein
VSDVARLHSAKLGLHSNAADFTTFPSSLVPLQILGGIDSMLPRARAALEHDAGAVDGRGYPHRWGGKDLAPVTFDSEVKGANSNSGGAVSDWEAKLELGPLFASMFGAVATATTNAATTCSGTAGATLTVTDGTDIPNGAVILFTTTTGSFVRRVTSGGGTTTLTLDRAASGTASGTVIRLGVYSVAMSRTAHTHLGLDVEGTTADGSAFRQRFFGLAPNSLELMFPETGIVMAKASLMPTDWDQPAAATPSFTAPTAGAPIAVNGYTFADATFGALDFAEGKLSINNGITMRKTGSGPNGVRGGVAATKRGCTLEGLCYLGGSSPGSQMTYANAKEWLGSGADGGDIATTRALSLQVGTEAGGVMGVFLPDAAVKGTVVVVDGLVGVRFTATATTTLIVALG